MRVDLPLQRPADASGGMPNCGNFGSTLYCQEFFLPRICDYEGSRYRTDFWEGQNRHYEDGVERVAMQKLLPPAGRRLIEVGAGFGRLADLYRGYQQVVLTDYARTQLEEARAYLGEDERFIYVHEPYVDVDFGKSITDCVNMPIARKDFERMARCGRSAQRAAVILYSGK